MCSEVTERLDKDRETNQRRAQLLTLTVRLEGDIRPSSYTRSISLSATYDKSRMARDCLAVMSRENPSKQPNVWNPVVTSVGVSASKFVDLVAGNTKIDRFFAKRKDDIPVDPSPDEELVLDDDNESTNEDEDIPLVSAEEDSQDAPLPKEVVVEKVADVPKKTGFFASRIVQKKLEQIRQEPVASTSSNTKPTSTMVNELFPDLDKVDMDTLALLPLDIQREVRVALSARGASTSEDVGRLVVCDTCGKKLLKEEEEEHKDYHLALQLQKEMSGQLQSTSSSSSSGAASTKGKAISSSKSTKRPKSQKSKKTDNLDSKRTRTIETFFRNPTI